MIIKADINNSKTGQRLNITGEEDTVMFLARYIWMTWFQSSKCPNDYFELPSQRGHFGDDFLCTEGADEHLRNEFRQAFDKHMQEEFGLTTEAGDFTEEEVNSWFDAERDHEEILVEAAIHYETKYDLIRKTD